MDDNYAFGLCYHMYILIYVLMAQTMREWSEQKSLPLRYVGICSDTRAGRNDEDASLLELDYPVTTDIEKIREGLQAERPEALTVGDPGDHNRLLSR